LGSGLEPLAEFDGQVITGSLHDEPLSKKPIDSLLLLRMLTKRAPQCKRPSTCFSQTSCLAERFAQLQINTRAKH
jgi:hypothetical protein